MRSRMVQTPQRKQSRDLYLQLGSHDARRMTELLGPEYACALNMALLLLPGTPTTFYGEEILMRPVHVSYENTQDPVGKFFGPVS